MKIITNKKKKKNEENSYDDPYDGSCSLRNCSECNC